MLTSAHSGLGRYEGFVTPTGTELHDQVAAFHRLSALDTVLGTRMPGEVIHGTLTGNELVAALDRQSALDEFAKRNGITEISNSIDLGRNGDRQPFRVGNNPEMPLRPRVTDEEITATAGGARPYAPEELTDDVRALCAAQLPE